MSTALTEQDVTALLTAHRDPRMSQLATDGKLVKAIVGLCAASLKIADAASKDDAIGMGMALTGKGIKLGDAVAAASSSISVKASTFIANETVKTIGLYKLAGKTPAQAMVQVSVISADKILTAIGLTDQQLLSKCQLALLAMSSTAGLTAISAPTGVGAVVGLLGLAGDIVNVYAQCRAEQAL